MKKSVLAVSLLTASLLLSGCGGSSASSSNSSASSTAASAAASTTAAASSESTAEATEAEASSGENIFKDGVLTTPDMKIVITDHKIIAAGKKGNEYGDKPVIAFWYKITNVSGEDMTPSNFIFNFKAYQDNNPNAENELNVGSLPDDKFLDTQLEKIKKGGTVENAIAYELDDLKTPVDLVAASLFGDEYGRMSYPVK